MKDTRRTIYSFIGLPASGKDTQAEIFIQKVGLKPIVSAGDLVRKMIELDPADPFIADVKKKYDEGIPQSDEIVIDLVKDYLTHTSESTVFANFPFSTPQAKFIFDFVEENSSSFIDPVLVFIKTDPETSVKRAISRKVCSSCDAVYGVTDDMICEKCGGALIVRSDDNEDTVRERVARYLPKTREVVEYYRTHGGTVHEINGEQSVLDVAKEIESKLCTF